MIRRQRIFMTCFLGTGAFALTMLMFVYLTIPDVRGMGIKATDIALMMLGSPDKTFLEVTVLILLCALAAAMVTRILVTAEHQQLILRKQLFSTYANLQQAQDELRHVKDTLKQVTKTVGDMSVRLRWLEQDAPKAVLASSEYEVPGEPRADAHIKLALESVSDELAQASDAVREMMPSTQSLEHTLNPLAARTKAASDALVALDTLVHRINRLVLNASLEAARLGDQGEGLIRLMEEFKMLAHDTAEQAATIGEQMWHVKETISSTHSPLATLREDADATLRHLSEATELLDAEWDSLIARPQASAPNPAITRGLAAAAEQAAELEKKILTLVSANNREAA